jgi:pimeloyl-ACP methyl ester carboxylesterase
MRARGGAAAWLGFARGALRRFRRAAARRGILGHRHRRTAHGTSPGTFSDLPRFRDSLAEVLRAHEPIHAVIGHSLGGGAVLTVLAEPRTITRRGSA